MKKAGFLHLDFTSLRGQADSQIYEQKRRQKSALRWLTVHILTASTRAAGVKEALARGANSYFIKPSRMEDLLELVKAWHCVAQFSEFYPAI